jgi:hypothetical protein
VNSGGSKIIPDQAKYYYFFDNPDKTEVEMKKFDKIAKDKQFDLIVMDIEGSEYFALKGMSESLEKCKYLQIEYVPHHLEDVSNISNETFLKPIKGYFDEVIIQERGENYESEEEILNFLDKLRAKGESANLLFKKA